MEQLINLINEMISSLSHDLMDAELLEGWTDDKMTKWLNWFEELKEYREKGGEFKRGILSGITRTMDFDGISSGRLTTQAS